MTWVQLLQGAHTGRRSAPAAAAAAEPLLLVSIEYRAWEAAWPVEVCLPALWLTGPTGPWA